MKRISILPFLALVFVANGLCDLGDPLELAELTPAASGGSSEPLLDDFNRANSASLGANWTEDTGDASIASNAMSLQTAAYVDIMMRYNTDVSSLNGYVKVSWTSSAATSQFPSIYFRYTDSSSPSYWISFQTANDEIYWQRRASNADDAAVTVQSTVATVDDNDTWGVTWTGTGTATTVRLWKNPTGNAPTTVSLWGGNAPDFTFTNDPASPVDTGLKVGLGGEIINAGDVLFDNFSAGGSL